MLRLGLLCACLQDPVHDEPTVLVSLFNVTSQKELEAQLKAHKELLQR